MNRTLAIFIASLAFLPALALSRSSTAGEIYGTWDGVVSFQTETWRPGQPQPVYSSGAYYGELSLDFYTGNTELSESIGEYTIIGYLFANPFGPNFAAGSVVGSVYPGQQYGGTSTGNFDVNYQSILPDGSIDTSYSFAEGSMYLVLGHPGYNGGISEVSFNTVPEPSAFALAASALIIIGIFAWVRRSRPQRCPRTA